MTARLAVIVSGPNGVSPVASAISSPPVSRNAVSPTSAVPGWICGASSGRSMSCQNRAASMAGVEAMTGSASGPVQGAMVASERRKTCSAWAEAGDVASPGPTKSTRLTHCSPASVRPNCARMPTSSAAGGGGGSSSERGRPISIGVARKGGDGLWVRSRSPLQT